MLVIVDVQTERLGTEGICYAFKALVEAVGEQNKRLFLRHKLPSLYDTRAKVAPHVRFRNEPWAGKFENIASALVVLKRGWGDCDDLVAYRIGELRAKGIDATAKVYIREHRLQNRIVNLYHVEVRLPDGSVEDPARYLGM